MSRQTRMLLVLVVMSVAGLAALTLVAQRYTKMLAGQAGEVVAVVEPAALARVDGFIQVRRDLQAAIRRVERQQAPGVVTMELLRRVRSEALARHGIAQRDYHEVRDAYRTWRAGWQAAGDLPNAAFEKRRQALEQLDLGAYERLDA